MNPQVQDGNLYLRNVSKPQIILAVELWKRHQRCQISLWPSNRMSTSSLLWMSLGMTKQQRRYNSAPIRLQGSLLFVIRLWHQKFFKCVKGTFSLAASMVVLNSRPSPKEKRKKREISGCCVSKVSTSFLYLFVFRS